jgi:eukaryotic translation initiation factor 2C
LTAPPNLTLYRYDVAVSPTATGRKLKQIVNQLLQSPQLADVAQHIVTDFKSTLISSRKLELSGDPPSIPVVYRNENHEEPRDDAPTYTVRVLLTNTLTVGDFVGHLKSTDSSAAYAEKAPMIQALNIILNHRSRIHQDLVCVGSNKTFSIAQDTATYTLGAGLTAVRGFFASVRAATARVLVNVNVSHGAFYNAGPLENLMAEYTQRNRSMASLASFVSKLRVSMRHLPPRKNKKGETIIKVKTVLGLATQNDGHGLAHPPRVKRFGAGPKDVEFWMDASPDAGKSTLGSGGKKKGKGKGAPQPQGSAGGRYISVFDYFKQSECAP